jgi:hypothetical protein
MFKLIGELENQRSTSQTIAEATEYMRELLEMHATLTADDVVEESVQALADKFSKWLAAGNITPEDLGYLVAGISLLVSEEGRAAFTPDDLVGMGLQPDLQRADKIDNVDLNTIIRNQIINLGKQRGGKLASNVIQAIRNNRLDQVRNYILKLSTFVDRIKKAESTQRMSPVDVKNTRRAAPAVQNVPSAGR